MRLSLWSAIVGFTLLLSATLAWSQGEFSGEVDFSAPGGPLEPDTRYDFEFTVRNTSTPSDVTRWIATVDLYLPSTQYAVEEEEIDIPRALHHEDLVWDAQVSRDEEHGLRIRWEVLALFRNFFGDIHEGESLDFSFRATTDNAPTDGFDWALSTDNGEMDTGTVEFGTTSESDDDSMSDNADDDDVEDDEDFASNDDDDRGGCGC